MKAYYYFLFRLYNTLSDPRKKNDEKTIIYLTTSTSTFLIYYVLYILFAYFNFYFIRILDKIVTGKPSVIILMVIIGVLNYFFFVKNKKYLKYGFNADKKGGYAIIGFIVLLAMSFVFIANKNRDKIFKEREKAIIESNQ
ncbi:hypothetical protein FLACOL_00455 [Flavobacterium columnare]|uniref:DUF4234 domain-containing protein n=2 Tax=Flavobacterium TaxID=237 RepID=A0ABW8PQB2_9FLAO|nr:hypothetical protein [Flavobacterium columnare]SPE76474.1 hypothetical protein FLACOL_00455 [Flavobacterium columnare]